MAGREKATPCHDMNTTAQPRGCARGGPAALLARKTYTVLRYTLRTGRSRRRIRVADPCGQQQTGHAPCWHKTVLSCIANDDLNSIRAIIANPLEKFSSEQHRQRPDQPQWQTGAPGCNHPAHPGASGTGLTKILLGGNTLWMESKGGLCRGRKIVVNLHGILLGVGLWLLLIGGFIRGWRGGGFFFAILSRIAAAVFGAIFPGAFLVLNHIRARVKAIAEQQKR